MACLDLLEEATEQHALHLSTRPGFEIEGALETKVWDRQLQITIYLSIYLDKDFLYVYLCLSIYLDKVRSRYMHMLSTRPGFEIEGALETKV